MRKRNSWQLVLGRVVVAGLLVGLAACSGGAPPGGGAPRGAAPGFGRGLGPQVLPLSGPILEATGRLVYVQQGALWTLWTLEPSTGTKEELLAFPPNSLPSAPAVSPDGKLIVYSLLHRGQEVKEPAAGLYVIAADGANQRLVLARDVPGSALVEPAWAPDGQTLYFTYRAPDRSQRIERVGLDGSERGVVVQDAHSPTVSADGTRLAYLTTDPATVANTLWVSQADGANPQPLMGAPEFRYLMAPRFAPGGQRLVLSAVVGEGQSDAPGRPSQGGPTMRLGPAVAHAHGLPYDLWLVSTDGGERTRLTQVQEDAPIPAWSPDGKWIAFSGELGLYLVDTAGEQVRRLSDQGAWSGLAWLAR